MRFVDLEATEDVGDRFKDVSVSEEEVRGEARRTRIRYTAGMWGWGPCRFACAIKLTPQYHYSAYHFHISHIYYRLVLGSYCHVF